MKRRLLHSLRRNSAGSGMNAGASKEHLPKSHLTSPNRRCYDFPAQNLYSTDLEFAVVAVLAWAALGSGVIIL